MNQGSVIGIAYKGAAYHSAKILGLADHVIALMDDHYKELTSAFPVLPDLSKAISGASHATEIGSSQGGKFSSQGTFLG